MNFDLFPANPKEIARRYVWTGGVFFFLGYGSIFLAKRYFQPTGDAYLKFEEMHGTVCVFYGIVPMVFAGLGYFIMPFTHESRMRFPRFDSIGLGLFYLSVILMLLSLLLPGRAIWLLAMFLNIAFAIVCSMNFIATIIYRCKAGAAWIQMRPLVWTLSTTAFLVFFNFLLLEWGAVMQLSDVFLGSNFYPPSPRIVGNQPIPIFWKHLFWFLGHPEVYILLLAIVGAAMDGLRHLFKKFR